MVVSEVVLCLLVVMVLWLIVSVSLIMGFVWWCLIDGRLIGGGNLVGVCV